MMICPPDPLCRWLGDRWETMQELADAIEVECGWKHPKPVSWKRHRARVIRGARRSRKEDQRVRRMMQIVTGKGRAA